MPNWTQRVVDTIGEEFADLPDVAQVTRVTVRLLVAAILGGLLGYERERKGKAAGMRTYMLVALGAALFVMIPQQMKVADADLTRVLQGLVAGVGLLGAGAIVRVGDQSEVKGLTTAAGVWLTAAIGTAAGMGREATAILCTVLALIVLSVFPQVAERFAARSHVPKPSATDWPRSAGRSIHLRVTDAGLVAASVLEDEDVSGGGIATEDGADDAGEAVDPLAAVLRFDGHADGSGGAKFSPFGTPASCVRREAAVA